MSNVSQAVTARNTAPAKVSPREALEGMINRNTQAIGLSLPRSMDRERFKRLLLTAAVTNPELFECDPKSFLAAGVACAQLGLEPNDARGLAYLIPFKDKRRGKVVQLVIGYRGMLDLARRSGQVTSVKAEIVFNDCDFRMSLGLEPNIEHHPGATWLGDRDPKKITHVYATAKIGGDTQFVVLTRAQVEKAKASSRGASSEYSPWQTHYEEMAAKTALRRLAKLLPQTVEVATAMDHDEAPLQLGDLGTVGAIPADDFEPEHDAIEAASTDDNAEGE